VSYRKLVVELASLTDKNVEVRTITGKIYSGKLYTVDPNSFNVCLADARDESGNTYSRVFIYSHAVSEILVKEAILDLKELAERLERIFPHMVKYYEDARVIVVMDRIRVSEKGVEGEGPLAEKVRRIYEEFLAEQKK